MKSRINPSCLTSECECSACPETHNFLYEGKEIGYLRLRHGVCRITYTANTEPITLAILSPRGDGCFIDDEGSFYMAKAKAILCDYHNLGVKQVD